MIWRQATNTVSQVCVFTWMANDKRSLSDAASDSPADFPFHNAVALLLHTLTHTPTHTHKKPVFTSFFPLLAECHDKQNFSFFKRKKIIIKPSSPPPLFALPFAYQRNPNGTCFAYLHLISNFKWTCQKWSSFLFWMRQDYLACIISASTCNISHKTKQADFKQHKRHLLYCLSLGILKYSCLTLDPRSLLNDNSFPIIKTKIWSVRLWWDFFAMTLGSCEFYQFASDGNIFRCTEEKFEKRTAGFKVT